MSASAGRVREGSPRLARGVGVACISAAALMVEVTLTRLFSVAQFYHYAFMIVSLAMLGSGISGMVLALFPRWGRDHLARSLGLCALGFGISATGAYVIINQVPFDSFSVAWDFRQIGVLALHYQLLSLPFFSFWYPPGGPMGITISPNPFPSRGRLGGGDRPVWHGAAHETHRYGRMGAMRSSAYNVSVLRIAGGINAGG